MIKSQIQSECINHYYLIHIHLKCRKPIDDYECLSLAAVLPDRQLFIRNERWMEISGFSKDEHIKSPNLTELTQH